MQYLDDLPHHILLGLACMKVTERLDSEKEMIRRAMDTYKAALKELEGERPCA